MTEDEMCAEWLRKRDYHVVITDHVTWLRRRHITAYEHREVRAEDMGLWIRETRRWQDTHQVTLHKVQGRDGRRPLRSLIREWMLGL